MPDFTSFTSARRWVKLEKGQTLPEGITTAFTDGACQNNPRGPAGWGWWRSEASWAAGCFEVASNNVAELEAIRQVLISAPSGGDIAIVSDSEYAVMAISCWAMGWKRRGWRKSDGLVIENQSLIVSAHTALLAREGRTYLKRVRGHGKDASMLTAHVVGNDHADRLACEAKCLAIAGDAREVFGPGWAGEDRVGIETAEVLCGFCGRAEPIVETLTSDTRDRRVELCSTCSTSFGDRLTGVA